MLCSKYYDKFGLYIWIVYAKRIALIHHYLTHHCKCIALIYEIQSAHCNMDRTYCQKINHHQIISNQRK
jgi:hypothetical protein